MAQKISIFLILFLLLTNICFAGQVWITDPVENRAAKVNSDRLETSSNRGSTFDTGQMAIGNTAQAIGTTSPVLSISLSVDPKSTSNCMYIGSSAVTNSTGMFLASGSILTLHLSTVSGLYAIADGDGQVLSIITEKP